MILATILLLGVLTSTVDGPAAPAPPTTSASVPDPAATLFDGQPRLLAITVDAEGVDRLRNDPRRYVSATLVDGERTMKVAVKLKGAAGSFREFDDRPALTVAVNRSDREQRFHGLARFHLNNSVQDPTLLNEWLASEIFREAGIPATRVTHARVRLNDRDLGIYVLKESFDEHFLARHFARTDGNLYDGGLLQDLDAELELDSGSGPKDRSDLAAIVAARAAVVDGPSLAKLWELVDREAFLRFMAVERLIGHWDGYVGSANNYRLYVDPARGGRAVFLPHGLDQLFEDPHVSPFDESETLIGSAISRFDEPRARLRAVIAERAPLLSDSARSLARLDRGLARLRPAVAALGEDAVRSHDEAVASLRERLSLRAAALPELLAAPEPAPLSFDGAAPLAIHDWEAQIDDDRRAQIESIEGIPTLRIRPPEKVRPRELGADDDESGEFGPTRGGHAVRLLLRRGEYHVDLECRVSEAGDQMPPPAVILETSLGERTARRPGAIDWEPLRVPVRVIEDRRWVTVALRMDAIEGVLSLRSATIRRVDGTE